MAAPDLLDSPQILYIDQRRHEDLLLREELAKKPNTEYNVAKKNGEVKPEAGVESESTIDLNLCVMIDPNDLKIISESNAILKKQGSNVILGMHTAIPECVSVIAVDRSTNKQVDAKDYISMGEEL